MRHLDCGDLSVFALTDCAPAPAQCAYSFPDAVLADAPEAARWFADGLFHTRFGPFLLRDGQGDVLVDCGMGPGPNSYFPGLAGRLGKALKEAGSGLELVSAVVFTHLHVDHVGWAQYLPSARFFVADAEWAHWRQGAATGLPHHTEAVARCIAPLEAAGRLHAVPAGEILPGIALLPAIGHTPGHHAVLVRDRLLIAGDTWHNPAQVEMAAWCHRADMDKPAAIATRRRMAGDAHGHAWVVGAGHFVEAQAFGRIVAKGEGLAFAPL